jgi:hypothetical protein
MEAKAWSADTEYPLLVAAVAAALVEYRRQVVQANGQDLPDPARSNWRLVTRVTQLGRLR